MLHDSVTIFDHVALSSYSTFQPLVELHHLNLNPVYTKVFLFNNSQLQNLNSCGVISHVHPFGSNSTLYVFAFQCATSSTSHVTTILFPLNTSQLNVHPVNSYHSLLGSGTFTSVHDNTFSDGISVQLNTTVYPSNH
jgi:hypothetical protein